MTKPTIEIIAVELKSLTREMRKGFLGINKRLDISNDRHCKHETLIASLEKEDIRMAAQIKATKESFKSRRGTWITISALITIVLALLGIYVY